MAKSKARETKPTPNTTLAPTPPGTAPALPPAPILTQPISPAGPSDSTTAISKSGYTVLARRYRPQTFEDCVGQDHVVAALKNAIALNRVAHAYLFTGVRGVGKTSMARILAKALNCVHGPTVQPCNQCDNCRAIATGEDVDVIEIDGASNRGIEEIRDLRQGVNYRPSRSRFKIYIIDEVHMLTKEAFNALLKTLEEPPPHIKFFFATTEPQKIPVTILSRCQRFDFAGMDLEQLVGRLQYIVQAEGMQADAEALELVARRAGGSMRDSQSLLDQLLAFGSSRLTVQEVHLLLGTATEERIQELAQAIFVGDAGACLRWVAEATHHGTQLGELVDQLLTFFRDLMATLVDPQVPLLSISARQHHLVQELCQRTTLPRLLEMMDLLAHCQFRLRTASQGRLLLEMTLVRLCRLDQFVGLEQLSQRLSQLSPHSGPSHSGPANAGSSSTGFNTKSGASLAPAGAPVGSPAPPPGRPRHAPVGQPASQVAPNQPTAQSAPLHRSIPWSAQPAGGVGPSVPSHATLPNSQTVPQAMPAPAPLSQPPAQPVPAAPLARPAPAVPPMPPAAPTPVNTAAPRATIPMTPGTSAPSPSSSSRAPEYQVPQPQPQPQSHPMPMLSPATLPASVPTSAAPLTPASQPVTNQPGLTGESRTSLNQQWGESPTPPPSRPIIELTPANAQQSWTALYDRMADHNLVLWGMLKLASRAEFRAPHTLVAWFPADYKNAKKHCEDAPNLAKIQGVAGELFGPNVQIRFEQLQAETSEVPRTQRPNPNQLRDLAEQMPLVRKAAETLGARILTVDRIAPPRGRGEADEALSG